METIESAKTAAVEGLPFLVEKVCVSGVGRSGSVAVLLTRQPLKVQHPLTCVLRTLFRTLSASSGFRQVHLAAAVRSISMASSLYILETETKTSLQLVSLHLKMNYVKQTSLTKSHDTPMLNRQFYTTILHGVERKHRL